MRDGGEQLMISSELGMGAYSSKLCFYETPINVTDTKKNAEVVYAPSVYFTTRSVRTIVIGREHLET